MKQGHRVERAIDLVVQGSADEVASPSDDGVHKRSSSAGEADDGRSPIIRGAFRDEESARFDATDEPARGWNAQPQGRGQDADSHSGRLAGNDEHSPLREGQVRGLQNMVGEDRYCADIMTQISSVHEALRAVSRELMRNHLRHCAAAAIKSGPEDAEVMYDELIGLMYTHVR